jgi:hypothetical protein
VVGGERSGVLPLTGIGGHGGKRAWDGAGIDGAAPVGHAAYVVTTFSKISRSFGLIMISTRRPLASIT